MGRCSGKQWDTSTIGKSHGMRLKKKKTLNHFGADQHSHIGYIVEHKYLLQSMAMWQIKRGAANKRSISPIEFFKRAYTQKRPKHELHYSIFWFLHERAVCNAVTVHVDNYMVTGELCRQ